MDELVFPTPRSTVAPADRQSLSLDGSSLVVADEKGNPPHSTLYDVNSTAIGGMMRGWRMSCIRLRETGLLCGPPSEKEGHNHQLIVPFVWQHGSPPYVVLNRSISCGTAHPTHATSSATTQKEEEKKATSFYLDWEKLVESVEVRWAMPNSLTKTWADCRHHNDDWMDSPTWHRRLAGGKGFAWRRGLLSSTGKSPWLVPSRRRGKKLNIWKGCRC